MSIFNNLFPNGISKKDLIIAVAGITLIAGSIYILLNYEVMTSEKSSQNIAILISRNNVVSHKHASDVSFKESAQGTGFQASDEVFIGENSQAKIQFINSKTEIIAPSGTLLRIEEGKEGENVAVIDGLAQFIIQKGKKLTVELQGKRIEMQADNESAKINTFIEDGQIKLKSISGQASMISEKKKTKMENNVAIVAKKNESPKLKIKELIVTAPKNLDKSNILSGIPFDWQGPSKIEVDLSKTEDFSTVIASAKFENSPKRWFPFVRAGDYFLKIKTESQDKIVPIHLFFEIGEGKIEPSENENLTLTPKQAVTFKWPTIGDNNVSFHLKNGNHEEVSNDINGNEYSFNGLLGRNIEWTIFKKNDLGKNIPILGPNHFTITFNGKFNVKSTLKEQTTIFTWTGGQPGERFKASITNEEDSSFSFHKELSSPELAFQTEKVGKFNLILDSLDYPRADKTEYTFYMQTTIGTWSESNQKMIEAIDPPLKLALECKTLLKPKQKFPLEIAIERAQGESIVRKMFVQGEKFAIELKKFGTYCFRLTPPEEMSYLTPSEKHCIEFKQAPLFSPIVKPTDMIMRYAKIKGLDAYVITLPEIKNSVRYEVEIYKDNKASELIFSAKSARPVINWVSKRSGIFYVRYRVVDIKNRASQYSELSRIMFPISPLDAW